MTKRIALFILLSLSLYAVPAAGADLPTNSLKGVKSFNVVVEEIGKDSEEFGLPDSTIKTDVELRLRKAGVRVSSTPAWPLLYVSVNVMKIREDYFAAAVIMRFEQPVRLERNGTISLGATWDTGGLVLAERPERVRGFVGDLTDRFINSFLEANQK